MTDATAAPEDRYSIGNAGVNGCYVIDLVLDKRVSSAGLTWAAAHCEAQRLNREARAASRPAPERPAPCCGCAAKLKAAEEKAERYRHALAQIWRSCSGTALRYASEALFADARKREEEP